MSSFSKRRGTVSVAGTRASLHSGQAVLSAGNPSLDFLFGGGLPIGSVVAIEEDRFGTYTRAMQKFFIAEGLISSHSSLVATLEEDPKQFAKTLPNPIVDKNFDLDRKQNPAEMRIAFRYVNQSPIDSEQTSSTKFGHYYDLSKHIDESELATHDITYWDGTQPPSNATSAFTNPQFQSLLDAIHRKSTEPQFDPSNADGKKNLLRICLSSIGSPLWYDDNFPADLVKFVTILKAFVQNTVSCCLITLPTHLFRHLDDNNLHDRLIDQFDFCFSLDSFAGTDRERTTAYKDYHGLMHLVKISALNTLAPFVPETGDLAFRLRRKKFVVEKFHLPPELGEDKDERGQKQAPTMSCSGGAGSSKLDF